MLISCLKSGVGAIGLSNLLIDYSVTPFKLKSREPVMIVSKSIIILISESPINILYVGSKNLSAFSEC